jgi:hypothetical protein
MVASGSGDGCVPGKCFALRIDKLSSKMLPSHLVVAAGSICGVKPLYWCNAQLQAKCCSQETHALTHHAAQPSLMRSMVGLQFVPPSSAQSFCMPTSNGKLHLAMYKPCSMPVTASRLAKLTITMQIAYRSHMTWFLVIWNQVASLSIDTCDCLLIDGKDVHNLGPRGNTTTQDSMAHSIRGERMLNLRLSSES